MQITESDKSRLAEIGNAVNNAPWGKPARVRGDEVILSWEPQAWESKEK